METSREKHTIVNVRHQCIKVQVLEELAMLEESRFDNVLKFFRVRKGKAWTQERTADLLGVSLCTYKGWESGESIPSSEYLKAIVVAFELVEEDKADLYRAAAHVPPRVHTLPFLPNPFFTGRDTQLKQLRKLLEEKGSVVVTQSASVSGLGGIGKTQLALEYAHQCYREKIYRAVFWIDAAEKATIEASYLALACLLELPEQEKKMNHLVQAVKQWLEEYTQWLLIMDNAADMHLACSYLPAAY